MEKSKVAVVACPDYEPARVKESLQKGLEAIGGLESLVGKEENILLKPNLVRSAKRERAVVTDPEVMDALITILQENGYENISCGDSCGLGTPEGIAKEAGLKEVLEKHNVPLKDFLTSSGLMSSRQPSSMATFLAAEIREEMASFLALSFAFIAAIISLLKVSNSIFASS